MKLLARCKMGDPDGWEALFTTYADKVYRWAVFLGLEPEDAADAAQEVFFTASRRISSCSCEEVITSWLFQITRRIAANFRRKTRWHRVLFKSEPSSSAFMHDCGGNIDIELATRRCLLNLPAEQREVLILMEFEGLTRDETSQTLGIPAGTVASRHRLAIKAFRKLWCADEAVIPELAWEEHESAV